MSDAVSGSSVALVGTCTIPFGGVNFGFSSPALCFRSDTSPTVNVLHSGWSFVLPPPRNTPASSWYRLRKFWRSWIQRDVGTAAVYAERHANHGPWRRTIASFFPSTNWCASFAAGAG